jgi:hypothetical protein
VCFSPEASFAVSGALVPAGVYCIVTAVRTSWAHLPLASIPLFFAAQQVCEGFVWLGLGRDDNYLVRSASLGFLFFGLLFWLVWIPLSVIFLEMRPRIRVVIGIVALAGLVGGLVLYVPLVVDSDLLSTIIVHHSIRYKFDGAPLFALLPREVWQVYYFAVVATPVIISRAEGFGGFGILLLASAVVSHLFYWQTFVSVWCFFAAILSAYLCVFFRRLARQPKVDVAPEMT